MDKTTRNLMIFLSASATLTILVVSLCLWWQSNLNASFRILPQGAKVVRDMGEGWSIIDVDGRKYLYRSTVEGSSKTIVMTPY